ncbi:MAG TPA: hypothetical protein VK721_05255 [Solirubrobacteraceae bacterium]|nr:hypothetical protein [Solirubrobacteraceae bacterium]
MGTGFARRPGLPAFVTRVSGRLSGVSVWLVDRLEVAGECWAWFDGHDRVVVLPDVVEEDREELAALGWVGLGVPEAGEVVE